MKPELIKGDDGVWRFNGSIEGAHPSYQPALDKYVNCLEPFFARAKQASEFDFLFSILRLRGAEDPGWDPFDTLQSVFYTFHKVKQRYHSLEETVHYALFLYGLIIEASAPYDVLANLVNIIEGKRYQVRNFNDDQTPGSKIASLISRAESLGLDATFLNEFYDNSLRNAVFHSDYSVYESEVRISHRGRTQTYSRDRWHELVNRSQAYYEIINKLIKEYRAEYKGPLEIEPHPEFSRDPDEKALVLVREGEGAIGLRDNWSESEISAGHIPWHIGNYLSYEVPMIEARIAHLPRNKIKRINRILRLLPSPVARLITKYYSGKFRSLRTLSK